MICKYIFFITFLNKPAHFFPIVKLFEMFLSNMNNSTYYYLFTYSGYKSYYLTLIILFNITHSFAHS